MALDLLTGCFGWQPTKLSRGDEKKSRAWMWAVNLILIIPVGIAAFAARDSYNLVSRHPELSQYPYHENAKLAFYLTYVGCVIIFPWVFLSSSLLLKWHGKWILAHGIVNLGLAITVAMGVSMQAEFLPGTVSGCKGTKAFDWQKVGDHLSFFELAAQLDKGDYTLAVAPCKNMVKDWTIATAVVFFQMLLAYVSIFFDEREFSLLNPMRPFVWLLLIVIAPALLIHDVLFPRIRLWFSYTKKGLAQLRRKKNLNILPLTQFKPQYQSFQVPKTKLMDVLVIEHVLLNVVDYMHHEDVVNLSLTCRAVREVVYPPRDLDYRVPKLNKHCCSLEVEDKCLYCNNKICTACRQTAFWPGLPGRRHVSECVAYCEPCYFKSFSRHPQGYKRPCKCYRTDRGNEDQECCRSCNAKNPEEVQAARHKRYQQEARDIAYKEGATCGSCRAELKSGMRWWICLKCGGECRDGIHPGFVRRKGKGKGKEKDVEKGEVDGGVASPWWRRWTGL